MTDFSVLNCFAKVWDSVDNVIVRGKLQALFYDILPSTTSKRCLRRLWRKVPESDVRSVCRKAMECECRANSGKHWFTTDILPPETAARKERVPPSGSDVTSSGRVWRKVPPESDDRTRNVSPGTEGVYVITRIEI